MARQMPSENPRIGTWKINLAKSTFNLDPAPKSYTLKQEPWEDGIKGTADMVDAQGNNVHAEVALKHDGKDYPVKGAPLVDTISEKRIDERTFEGIWKKDGKVAFTVKMVISADGKMMTITRTGTNAQGRIASNVMLLEKR